VPSPERFQESSLGVTRLVLGVIGHVDHGKTALVRALTGEDTDRLPEEKLRGISIALGFAQLSVGPDTVVDLIDMPGHERFVRTMISGATGIDAVLLVVAANEGIKPQTVEHIDIAGLLGLQRAVVAISKTDLVAPAQAQLVADEAVQLLARAGLTALPPVMTSALQQQGLDDLREALKACAQNQQPRSDDGLAFLPVDRAFSISGHGPVVTGTLRGAPVAAGDTLELWPLRRKLRVRAAQVHGARVETAAPGQRVALNLRDVETSELHRGMVLAAPDSLDLSDWLTISVRAVEGAPPLKNGARLQALLGTGEIGVRLRLLDRDVLEAGHSGYAQLHCAQAIALPVGEHVVLRLASPPQTVVGGRILQAGTRRLRRNDGQILQRLEALHTRPAIGKIAAELEYAGAAGTTLRALSQLCALAMPRIVALLQTLPVVVTRSGLVIAKAEMDRLLACIPSLLAPHRNGLSRARLLSVLPGSSAAVVDAALGRLLGHGLISERGSGLMLPRPDEDRAQARSELELALQIAETLREAGLTPPNPGAIMPDLTAKRVVDRLLREGVLVRAVDHAKDKELLFHRDAIAEARHRLAPLLAPPGLLVSEIAAALGITRKYCMPLLDHLDTIGFTRRIDDRRVQA
jgi:selenocysteine-specific elongation factor